MNTLVLIVHILQRHWPWK